MKYFTKEWHLGEYSVVKTQRIEEKYNKYFDENLGKFPIQFVDFLNDTTLHDALIECCVIDHAKCELSLRLICGENKIGYSLFEIVYLNVQVNELDIKTLKNNVSSDRTELLFDEIDNSRYRFIHRLLFWPSYDDVEISFNDFKFYKQKIRSRKRSAIKQRFIEIPKTKE